jgi:hypothetical protein
MHSPERQEEADGSHRQEHKQHKGEIGHIWTDELIDRAKDYPPAKKSAPYSYDLGVAKT